MARELKPPEFDDLMGLDLAQLDLAHIELDEDRGPNPIWRWVGLLVLAGLGALVLWLPSTELYQSSSASNALFALTCIVATVVGILGGRWLWAWAEDAANRWAARRRPRAKEPPKPPSPLQRWLTLLAAVGGGAAILFAVSPYQMGAGASGYSELWYLVAVGAIVVGFLLARWLLLQEHNPFRRTGPVRRVQLPPWFKWVSLGVLVTGSVGVLVGMELFGGGGASETLEFSLGGAAFVIGIFGAIWVARRFDEAETRIRREVAERRAAARGANPGPRPSTPGRR